MKENDPIPTLAPTWGTDVFPLLSWFKQERLDRANVMVVGCGALGNEVLKNLALFGVGHVVVVDFDTRATSATMSDWACYDGWMSSWDA